MRILWHRPLSGKNDLISTSEWPLYSVDKNFSSNSNTTPAFALSITKSDELQSSRIQAQLLNVNLIVHNFIISGHGFIGCAPLNYSLETVIFNAMIFGNYCKYQKESKERYCWCPHKINNLSPSLCFSPSLWSSSSSLLLYVSLFLSSHSSAPFHPSSIHNEKNPFKNVFKR